MLFGAGVWRGFDLHAEKGEGEARDESYRGRRV